MYCIKLPVWCVLKHIIGFRESGTFQYVIKYWLPNGSWNCMRLNWKWLYALFGVQIYFLANKIKFVLLDIVGSYVFFSFLSDFQDVYLPPLWTDSQFCNNSSTSNWQPPLSQYTFWRTISMWKDRIIWKKELHLAIHSNWCHPMLYTWT